MLLSQLPRDALDNVLSLLHVSDVLALARASPRLCLAVSSYLAHVDVPLHHASRIHLLAPRSRVAQYLRILTLHPSLDDQDLATLGPRCTYLDSLSFHNVATHPYPQNLARFLHYVGTTLTSFTAEFSAALPGPLVLPALANHCPALTRLTLRFTPHVYSVDIEDLARVGPQLLTLELDSCVGVDDLVVASVAQRCPILEELSVGAAEDISDDGILALADAPCATSLISLDIRGCMHVTDVSLFAIATNFTQLRHLNVWRVCLTSYAIRAVAEGLGETLETLVMGDCIGIDDSALLRIAENCDTLLNLEIAGLKQITDAGVIALFDANKTGKLKLETLTIDGCPHISEATVLAVTGLWDGQWTGTDTLGADGFWQKGTRNSDTGRKQRSKDEEYQNRYSPGTNNNYTMSNYCCSEEPASKLSSPDSSADKDDTDCAIDATSGSNARHDDWAFSVDVAFKPATIVSYLQKLSAIGTRKIRQGLWRHIRKARPDLELRVEVATETIDDGGMACRESCGSRTGSDTTKREYPCVRCGKWYGIGTRQGKNAERNGLVSLTTATAIDMRARSFVKYRDAVVLNEYSLP